MTNLFRQAKQLLDKKDSGGELTEEELGLVNIAIFATNLLPKLEPEYNEMPVSQGLEELAKITERKPVAVSRRRVVVNSPAS